jgi:hypothetical protein
MVAAPGHRVACCRDDQLAPSGAVDARLPGVGQRLALFPMSTARINILPH